MAGDMVAGGWSGVSPSSWQPRHVLMLVMFTPKRRHHQSVDADDDGHIHQSRSFDQTLGSCVMRSHFVYIVYIVMSL